MLQIRQSRIRQIIVFAVVLIAWSVGIMSFLFGKQVNWSQIFMGITGGFIVWICTYIVTNWIDPSAGVHYKTTTEIYDVVTRQYLSLVDKRRDAKNSTFYSQFYGSARTIKISGLANKSFFEYILSKEYRDKKSGGHLLQLMANKPISVEVLLMDPACDIINGMDEREPPGRNHVHFNNILEVLGMIKTLHKEATEGKLRLAPGSKLDVRLSRIPLNTTIFYVDGHQPEVDAGNTLSSGSILLMGMLYNHKDGDNAQLFKVPKDDGSSALYRDCLEHFNKTFELCRDEQILLLESGNKPHFDLKKYSEMIDGHSNKI